MNSIIGNLVLVGALLWCVLLGSVGDGFAL